MSHFLFPPSNVVVAGVRDRSNPTFKALLSLSTPGSSLLVVVNTEGASQTSAVSAMDDLRVKNHIDTIDVVIANAGVSDVHPKVGEAQIADMEHHYSIDVINPLVLIQAVLPLLSNSKQARVVVFRSSATSIVGSGNF